MNDKRKKYLKKWREDNKEHIRKYKKEYAKTHDSSFKKLQDKYKQLKENAENNDKVVDNVNWENQLLKKENQKLKEQNKKEFADYIKFKKEQYDEYLEKVNKLIKEKQELKKQLEENKDKINWYENFEINKTIDKLRIKHNNQQKEFINFLEDNYKETQDIWYIKVLQKYKSIIGDDK